MPLAQKPDIPTTKDKVVTIIESLLDRLKSKHGDLTITPRALSPITHVKSKGSNTYKALEALKLSMEEIHESWQYEHTE